MKTYFHPLNFKYIGVLPLSSSRRLFILTPLSLSVFLPFRSSSSNPPLFGRNLPISPVSPNPAKPWLHISDNSLNKEFLNNLKKRFNISKLSGGFKGYDLSFTVDLDGSYDLPLLRSKVQSFLSHLDDKCIFSLLPVSINLTEDDSYVYKSLFKESIKVSKDSNLSTLSDTLYLALDLNRFKYDLVSVEQVVFFYKLWVKDADLKVAYDDAVKTLDKVIHRRFVENKIVNQIGGSVVHPSHVLKDIQILLNNPLFAPLFNPLLIDYNGSFPINSLPYSPDNFYTFSVNHHCVDFLDIFTFEVFNSANDLILCFQDEFSPSTKTVIRRYCDLSLKFVNFQLVQTDVTLRMGELLEVPKDLVFDDSIGTIDLETCPSKDNSQLSTVYACAYSVNNETKTYWLVDNPEIPVIVSMFNDLFSNRLTNYTFYAHNLGRFDGHFLIKTLLDAGFDVVPTIKDDKTILCLKIRSFVPGPNGGKPKKVTLTLLDSILLLKSSLKQLGKDFNSSVLKTEFPHKFASLDNLSYIGLTPSIDYYNDISSDVYNSLLNDNWSFKDECLKYLTNDVDSLRNILLIFAKEIYDQFNLNITNFKTLPSLALSIFLSNFYNRSSNPIKVVKGDVEKNIRSAYHGGLVFVFEHEVLDAFQYDINSHYPNCLKNPMPVGNPTYTDNPNLDQLFGFVRAKVIAPDVSVLKNPILPLSSPDGLICPRGTFYGWWFSEELKNAVKYGYQVTVLGSWTFSQSNNLFNDYIDTLYKIKANSDSHPARRCTAKLLLNSLYGRMGLNEIDTRVKIIKSSDLHKFQNVNITEVVDLGEFSIIFYAGKLDPELVRLIDDGDLHDVESIISKRRGVPSSVSIAAAVTAYARIEISQFFNLPDNKCIATDTDMVVLEKPLDSSLLGPELGKFKLEYKIDHGIYIAPKTYCIKFKNPKNSFKDTIICKAKGLGGSHMTYEDYRQLLAGFDVIKEKTYFEPNLGLGTVRVYTQPFTIKGVVSSPNQTLNSKELRPTLLKHN